MSGYLFGSGGNLLFADQRRGCTFLIVGLLFHTTFFSRQARALTPGISVTFPPMAAALVRRPEKRVAEVKSKQRVLRRKKRIRVGVGLGRVDSSAKDRLVEVIGCWPCSASQREALAVRRKEGRERDRDRGKGAMPGW